MKEVIAIIRAEKWQATREAIDSIGVEEITQHRVLGRGRQRGLRYLRRSSGAGEGDMLFLPKRLVSCVVAEEKVNVLINAMMKVNQTGNYGDGKIFVRPLTVMHEVSAVNVKTAVAIS